MRNSISLLALLALLAAACGPNAEGPGLGQEPDAGPGGGGENEFTDAAPAEACEKMDILFVIDNSGSMQQEQDNLIANFPGFASVIDNYLTASGQPLDYRIAVTTAGRDVSYQLSTPPPFNTSIPFSESGDNGEFRQSCGMTRRWIEKADSDVAGTFSCVANVGVGGPGAEMPLLGLEWSLNRRMADGTNDGFLRDDALLAIVMITDQDDCSRDDDGFTIDGSQPSCFDPADSNIIPLGNYLDFLDDLKGGRGRWATAVIAGTGPGSCSSSFGQAAEAVRMIDFVGQVGTNSILSSVCDGDLASALDDALDTFEAACNAFPPVE
jgi:hypothetical protein